LAAYFTRGTGHDENAVYSEDPEDWTINMDRIRRKLDTVRDLLPEPVLHQAKGAEVGMIAFGSTDPAVMEARDRLSSEGIPTDYLRLRAVPFSTSLRTFVEDHEKVYVIEMNSIGQMYKLLQLELPDLATRFVSLAHNDGLPLTARWISESITSDLGG
jgi:2-oxoglutarate ferredoxin oxidoreductase subunit alpha